jgi:hypothetical protein
LPEASLAKGGRETAESRFSTERREAGDAPLTFLAVETDLEEDERRADEGTTTSTTDEVSVGESKQTERVSEKRRLE